MYERTGQYVEAQDRGLAYIRNVDDTMGACQPMLKSYMKIILRHVVNVLKLRRQKWNLRSIFAIS